MSEGEPIFSASALFCDDIRMETTGKFILIGAYTGAMISGMQMPVALPTFSVWIEYLEKLGTTTEEVNFELWLPGEKLPSVIEKIVEPRPSVPDDQGRAGIWKVHQILSLRNALIRHEGKMRLMVRHGQVRELFSELEVLVGPDAIPSNVVIAPNPPVEKPKRRRKSAVGKIVGQ